LDLSVIIPNYNGRNDLEVCLESLFLHLGDISYEIILIDNGSTDGSIEFIKERFPSVLVIANAENRFYAAANNQGLEISCGRYILFLNSDTEVKSDVIVNMISYMDENPGVGSCIPIIQYGSGKIQNTCWRDTTRFWYFFVKFILINDLLGRIFPAAYRHLEKMLYDFKGLHSEFVDVDIISGCAMMVRRSVACELGGFDERYRLYCTDEEICLRIKKLGYRIVSLPYEKIVHHHSVTIRKLSGVFKILNEDIEIFIRENFGVWSLFIIPLYKLKSYFAYLYKK
jgi:GT2 family glycosyltransferase